eukprot:13790933-Alexandrium_andersonii.AAC.1
MAEQQQAAQKYQQEQTDAMQAMQKQIDELRQAFQSTSLSSGSSQVAASSSGPALAAERERPMPTVKAATEGTGRDGVSGAGATQIDHAAPL